MQVPKVISLGSSPHVMPRDRAVSLNQVCWKQNLQVPTCVHTWEGPISHKLLPALLSHAGDPTPGRCTAGRAFTTMCQHLAGLASTDRHT